METKTDMLEDIKLLLPSTTRVAEVQKEIEKKLGWEPTTKLERYVLPKRHLERRLLRQQD